MARVVMAVNDWPERDQHDWVVLEIEEGESDEQALERAKEYYDDVEFYITEKCSCGH